MEKEKTIQSEAVGSVYEVSYILLPSLATAQVPAKVASLKEAIVSAGGQLVSDENPILIDLAYPMTKVVQTTRHKVTTGHFGWIKFELGEDLVREGMEQVKKVFDTDDSIVRYLIINTVRENTLLHGKMVLKRDEKNRKGAADESELSDEVVPDAVVDDVPLEDGVDLGGDTVLTTDSEALDKSIDDLVIE